MNVLNDDEKAELDSYMKDICENLFGFGYKNKCTFESKTTVGDTPLHAAAIMGNLRAVELLIKSGANINAVGEEGYTPLHEAIEQDKFDIVSLLISNGADLSIETGNGVTPYKLAEGNEKIISILK